MTMEDLIFNEKKIKSLEDLFSHLTHYLYDDNIQIEDGIFEYYSKRHLVDNINKIKIEIYSNEHPPPHFHVSIDNKKASFTIGNCSIVDGKINNKDYKKIKYWHNKFKNILIKVWNETRPDNCKVGYI